VALWWRFWIKIVVLLLRGPKKEEQGRRSCEATDFEFERKN